MFFWGVGRLRFMFREKLRLWEFICKYNSERFEIYSVYFRSVIVR